MRHASIATTQAYVHLARDARRDALERIASLIPSSVLPAVPERKHSENSHEKGGQAAVDIHPLMAAERGPAGDAQEPCDLHDAA